VSTAPGSPPPPAPQPDANLDPGLVAAVVSAVADVTGVDLVGYRVEGIARRLVARSVVVTGGDLGRYAEHLAVDPAEAAALLDDVLVAWTGWFRDPDVWQCLRDRVVPAALAAAGPRPLRAWCAGTGDGREVWSLAATLDAAGARSHEVVATDVSAVACRRTSDAVYGPPDGVVPAAVPTEPVPGDVTGRVRVAARLRSRVQVVRHDVREPPPPQVGTGGVDLVLCRNVLMYLEEGAQARVLDHLVAALRPGGVLVLGDAEMPLAHRDVLVPVDLASRVFRLIGSPVAG
jgi:two-component system CheB/CheR fusion protein